MESARPSLDVYLPLFSQSSPLSHNPRTPFVAFKKSSFDDDDEDDFPRFASPVDEQDADLLLHFATSPLSQKTPASSRSSAHTPTSRSSSSADLGDSGRPVKKRALSPFTPQDFDKAYPLHYQLSPLSISPVIRTSSPDYESLASNQDFLFPFKKRVLREVPLTPQKSSPSSTVDDLSPLSSISSLSDASSEDSPLASRPQPSLFCTKESRNNSPEVIAASRFFGISRRPSIRRSLSTSRALGSPAYRRRKLESADSSCSPTPLLGRVTRRHPLSRTLRSAHDRQAVKPLDEKPPVPRRIRLPSPPELEAPDQDPATDQDERLYLPLRTFPSKVILDTQFPLFYIRYPIYSCPKEDMKR